MDQLKSLLTEEGINFTDTTFKTEDGIKRLGEQPFVSKSVYLSILLLSSVFNFLARIA